ncbi:MAG TPA: zf-HC2 domain-containing protein [Thermoanaerobaculia bacterium]|nr:zf-HC2 domain-containing protein [Thermoanaerobaculia bacterium]
MDHAEIDEHQVAELYLMGKLPPEEAARFEEHSLACAECLDRLETAEKLRLGLRAVAARGIAAEAVRLSLLARVVRSRWAPAVLLLVFLVAVLPAGLLWRRFEAEHGEHERLGAELERARGPRINVPVVPLSPERSAPGSAPSTRISLAPSTDQVVLALDLGGEDRPLYRAVLSSADGRVLWQGSGLQPDAQGTLTIALPASWLGNGDFKVRVEGLAGRGGPGSAVEYSFRVVRGS